MPDILAIGFQEICDLTATNMVWQRYEGLLVKLKMRICFFFIELVRLMLLVGWIMLKHILKNPIQIMNIFFWVMINL